jgi:hypothetical protein
MGSGYSSPAAKRVGIRARNEAVTESQGRTVIEPRGRKMELGRISSRAGANFDCGKGSVWWRWWWQRAPQGLERWKQLVEAKGVVVAASVSMAGAGICCGAGCGGWAKRQRQKGFTAHEVLCCIALFRFCCTAHSRFYCTAHSRFCGPCGSSMKGSMSFRSECSQTMVTEYEKS